MSMAAAVPAGIIPRPRRTIDPSASTRATSRDLSGRCAAARRRAGRAPRHRAGPGALVGQRGREPDLFDEPLGVENVVTHASHHGHHRSSRCSSTSDGKLPFQLPPSHLSHQTSVATCSHRPRSSSAPSTDNPYTPGRREKDGPDTVPRALGLAALVVIAGTGTALRGQQGSQPEPKNWTTADDHQNMMAQLGIRKLRPGPSGNANAQSGELRRGARQPLPQPPDVLTLKNGRKVTTADAWWKQRRPEIVEEFDREVLGRVPKERAEGHVDGHQHRHAQHRRPRRHRQAAAGSRRQQRATRRSTSISR